MMVVMMVVPPAPFGMPENQRLYDHGNGMGIGQHLANIDKIKILEVNTIDGDNAGTRQKFMFDDIPHQFCNVRIKYQN